MMKQFLMALAILGQQPISNGAALTHPVSYTIESRLCLVPIGSGSSPLGNMQVFLWEGGGAEGNGGFVFRFPSSGRKIDPERPTLFGFVDVDNQSWPAQVNADSSDGHIDLNWQAPVGGFVESSKNIRQIGIHAASDQERKKYYANNGFEGGLPTVKIKAEVGANKVAALWRCEAQFQVEQKISDCIDDRYHGGHCEGDWRLVAASTTQILFIDASTIARQGNNIIAWYYSKYITSSPLSSSTYNLSTDCVSKSATSKLSIDRNGTGIVTTTGEEQPVIPPDTTIIGAAIKAVCSGKLGKPVENPLLLAFSIKNKAQGH